MKQQVFNPYLPSWEYIPDGEPYVFGDRVYVYGSHDSFGAPIFCVKDYVCWSAPVTDLSDWRYEGVIYRKNQDPSNKLGIRCLYAPDVTQGPDGRYYLYYAFDFMGEMGVAVCDTPAGKYEFYGHVHFKDGSWLGVYCRGGTMGGGWRGDGGRSRCMRGVRVVRWGALLGMAGCWPVVRVCGPWYGGWGEGCRDSWCGGHCTVARTHLCVDSGMARWEGRWG